MDAERTLRELSKTTWSYHEWWHRFDDDIAEAMQLKFGDKAPEKIREYRKARSAVTTALTDLASLVDAADGEG